MLKERMHSITDVTFEDAGNKEVPREYQQLFNEYCAEVDWLPVDAPLWCALECYYMVVQMPDGWTRKEQ